MDLQTYISDPDRRDALAAAVPVNPQYLWQMATRWRGKRPSPGMARAIERATRGAVTKESLRPDIWSPEPEEARDVA